MTVQKDVFKRTVIFVIITRQQEIYDPLSNWTGNGTAHILRAVIAIAHGSIRVEVVFGLTGGDHDRAAKRTLAVEGALRPSQDLD